MGLRELLIALAIAVAIGAALGVFAKLFPKTPERPSRWATWKDQPRAWGEVHENEDPPNRGT